MNNMRIHRGRMAGLGLRTMALATGLVVFAATPAFADTSQATANALRATLGTGPLLDSGTVTATNDGTQASPGTVTGNTDPALSVLGAQTLLAVGALPQQAVANPDGTSAACAGLVGTGGTIQIGPAGDCTVIGAPPGGVQLNLGAVLGGLSTLGVTADAIIARCTADSDGTTVADVQLVNASIGLSALGIPGVNIPLPASPTPGLVPDLGLLGLGGVLTLTLNEQSIPGGPGSIATTALHLNLLGTIDLRIGNVTCGPNAVTPPIPAFPVEGLPIAAATVASAAAVTVVVRRRRRASAANAA